MVDFSSIPNFVTFESDIDIIMQQIEILFDTRNGEVLGSYDFGTRFDTYLYNPNIGNQTVAQEVQQYIISNVELFNWNVSVDVQFLLGTQNDIMLISVILSNDTDQYKKTYKVSQGAVEYM